MENQLKATELRLGNIINDNNNFTMQVVGLFKDELLLDFEGNQGDVFVYTCKELELLKPIQLTEEILLRLGFEKGFIQYGFENYGLKCHKSLKENHWIVSQGFGMQFTELTEIQYIHQLQNLFFSLCGEELTFKN